MGDEANLERRRAAVLASDVAGYSRLMQIDEVQTLKAAGATVIRDCCQNRNIPSLVSLEVAHCGGVIATWRIDRPLPLR